MALGAQRADIVRQIMREGLTLALIGLVIGLPCSMVLSRFISSRLHGMSPIDPITYAVISLLCVAVAFAAVLLPARRATSNLMDALRFE